MSEHRPSRSEIAGGGVAVVGGERGREGREGSGRRTRKQVLEVRD